MANIITLTSSPPTTFARSPTPVTFSSSPRQISGNARSDRDSEKAHFKPAQASREGFSSGFTSARHVLAAKPNAKNVPVVPLKPPQSKLVGPPNDHIQLSKPAPTDGHSTISRSRPDRPVQPNGSSHSEVAQCTVIQVLPSDARRNKKTRNAEPLNLAKAIGRRNDWTPPKEIPVIWDNSSTHIHRVGVDLQQSFGNESYVVDTGRAYSAADNAPYKRRKIDSTIPVLKPMAVNKNSNSTNKTRNKSPAKKPLTITGLTTSHYLEDDPQQENASLMMQFLASTQARMQSDNSSEMVDTNLAKKPINSKAKKSRSRLKSPRTSMRTISEQEIIFATASQLARDDSPTLIRDTIKAIKQSEEDEESFADQVFTQQTAPISIESTSPKPGVARHRGRKNLWNAAHRDENDALLYHTDPFDETNVGVSLAGKDTLVDHGSVTDIDKPEDDSLALLAVLNKQATITYDIDDLTTPTQTFSKASNFPIEMKRSFSTVSHCSSKRMKDTSPPPQVIEHKPQDAVIDIQQPKIPPKPNYASWTDEQLKEQVRVFGFNRLRARKSMIDKLDEYWAQKYGLDVAAVKAATKAASNNVADHDHGSFLSNVHELAPRPVPKIKKSRAKKSDGEVFTSISKRKTKSKLVDVPKPTDAASDNIPDIDEIDGTTALERLAAIVPFPDEPEPMESLEPSTAPVRGTGVKGTTKPKTKRKKKDVVERPLTPPPTFPEDPIQDSSPGFESPRAALVSTITTHPTTIPNDNNNDNDPSLKSKIHAALLHTTLKNDRRRNHQTNPTWHEKILLYDPIVLEDFAAWLNTEGFNAVGIDEEIDAREVKGWCEENGVCCLWKGGWRGNKVKE